MRQAAARRPGGRARRHLVSLWRGGRLGVPPGRWLECTKGEYPSWAVELWRRWDDLPGRWDDPEVRGALVSVGIVEEAQRPLCGVPQLGEA